MSNFDNSKRKNGMYKNKRETRSRYITQTRPQMSNLKQCPHQQSHMPLELENILGCWGYGCEWGKLVLLRSCDWRFWGTECGGASARLCDGGRLWESRPNNNSWHFTRSFETTGLLISVHLSISGCIKRWIGGGALIYILLLVLECTLYLLDGIGYLFASGISRNWKNKM